MHRRSPVTRRFRLGARGESGQVLIIMAVAMIVIMGMVALVLDLAAVRQDQRSDRTAADLAAVSAASALDPLANGSPQAACNEAWGYIVDNLPGLPQGATFPCTSFPSTYDCQPVAVGAQPPTPALPVSESFASSTPQYTITMETPVPDSDPMMVGPIDSPVQPSHDGNQCQRFAVKIAAVQPFLFGPAVGVKRGATTESAVALFTITPGETFPALTALDWHACPAVSAGNGYIEAYAAVDPSTGATVSPGLIYADSDGAGYSGSGQCNNSKVVMQVNGQTGSASACFTTPPPTGEGIMCAQSVPATGTAPAQPGEIATYAFAVTPSEAYRPGFNYFPTPTELAKRITRAPVDTIYHCTSTWVPAGTPCPVDYINQLVNHYSSSTCAMCSTWTSISGSACSVTTTITITPPTYVDCPDTSGGFTIKGGTVDITGNGQPLVFAGSINFSSNGGNLCMIDSADPDPVTHSPPVAACDPNLADYPNEPDTIIYLQNSGSITLSSSSSMVLPHTFVYSNTGAYGCLNIGSNSNVSWSALAGNTAASAPYHKLMFWSEGTCSGGSNKASTFAGGGALNMDGILFSPNANFTIVGNSPVDARNVQFWVNTIGVSSTSAGLLLRADPKNAISTAGGVALIR